MAKKPPKQKRNKDGSLAPTPKLKPKDCGHPNYTTTARSDDTGWDAKCPDCDSKWFIPVRKTR